MDGKTQAGGAANISGVAYQILWCLLRATRIHLDAPDALQRAGDGKCVSTLLLEPAGGGGDVRVIGPRDLSVEQLKASADGTTWSLRSIITDILPDLLLASDPTNATDTTYRLVTEARMGGWLPVYGWFQDLRNRSSSSGVLEALDDKRELDFRVRASETNDKEPFFPDTTYNERSLFLLIASKLKLRPAIGALDLPEEELHRRLWDVLRGFEFDGARTRDQILTELDSHLLAIVDNRDDIPRHRDSLAWALLEKASHGNASITASELFSQQGLDCIPLTDWAGLRERGHRELGAALKRLRYDASTDVRTELASSISANWQQFPTRPLIITGESGQGKTWLLAAVARHATDGPAPVVLVEATDDYARDIQAAADAFWLDVRSSTGETSIPLRQVAQRLRSVVPAHGPVLLRLCFDKVTTYNEASAMIREDWPSHGIAVAIACSHTVAKALEEDAGSQIDVVHCGDFTQSELHELLRRRLGPHWTSVPGDIQETLRRPLLASIFCGSFDGAQIQPTSEYELYEAVWHRLGGRDQADFPLDAAPVEGLASDVFSGSTYPWTAGQLLAHGVDNACIRRLEACGWLVRTKDGHYRVFHDRLLNWAVAQALLGSLRYRADQTDDVVRRVAGIVRQEGRVGSPFLGYVPLDLLWLVTGDAALGINCGTALLAALETAFTHSPQELYTRLVPTLGTRAAECVFRRFQAANIPPLTLGPLAECLAQVGRDRMGEFAGAMLQSSDTEQQHRALMLLRRVPCPQLLDSIWCLHTEVCANPERFGKEHGPSWSRRNVSLEALQVSAKESPEWIVRAVRDADPAQEPVHDLCCLIACLSDGSAIWKQCKADLMAKVAPDHARALVRCIGRSRDSDEIGRLQGYLASQDAWVPPVAIQALARIAPNLAVAELSQLTPHVLAMSRQWCLAEVLLRRPAETHAAIVEWMRRATDPWSVGFAFMDRENDLTPEELDLLLNGLAVKLEHVLGTDADGQVCPLVRELKLIAGVQAPALLDVLQHRRGTVLEGRLADYVRRTGPRSGLAWHSLDVKPGMTVLHHMGSELFTVVVNEFLTCDNQYGRFDAVRWAHLRPDCGTSEALAQIVTRDDLWNGRFPHEQNEAMRVLAILGQWEPVARGLERWVGQTSIEFIHHRLVPRDFRSAWVDALRDRVTTAPTAGGIVALGFAGARDDIHAVHQILAQCPPDSPMAVPCILALIALEDRSDEGVQAVIPHLQVDAHRRQAKWMLAQAGTDIAWDALFGELVQRFDADDAINLINLSPRHAEAAGELLIGKLRGMGFEAPDLDSWSMLNTVLRHIRNPSIKQRIPAAHGVRDVLHSHSVSTEGPFWVVGSKSSAIAGLALVDMTKAFDTALHCLRDVHAHDRERYPYLLMEIRREAAVPLLVDHMDRERAWSVRFAIGRALSQSDFSEHLAERFEARSAETRASACFLASWLPSPDPFAPQIRRCLDDVEETVIKTAIDALDRLRQRSVCADLAERVRAVPPPAQRWVYLDALVDAIDPGDGFRPWPPILSEAAEWVHPFARRYLAEKLDTCCKALADKLKKRNE